MILFYLLITVLPLTAHPLWSRFVGDLTVIKYLGLACVLYAMTEAAGEPERLRVLRLPSAKCFLLLSALATASFFALTRPVAWEVSPLMAYLSLVMLLLTTVVLVNSFNRLRWVLLASIGAVAFASLYVLREFQKGYTAGQTIRPGYVVGDPNYFTASALMCLPLAFWLMQQHRPRWVRPYCIVCLVVTLLAVTVAASRGGFLGLMAAATFVLLRSRRRLRNLAILLAILVPLSLLSPISPLVRLLNPTFSDEDASESRYEMWKTGVAMFQANPIVGVGLGNFKALATSYQTDIKVERIAHNAYIELAAELGIFGLLIFVGVIVTTFITLERVRKDAHRAGSSLLYAAAEGIEAGLVGYSIAVFFVSGQYQRMFWLLVFVAMCLPRLTRQAQARRRREERETRLVPPASRSLGKVS